MITVDEILQDHCEYDDLAGDLKKNFDELLHKMNVLRFFYAKPMIINSGYRPPEYNKKIGGAPNSHHCYCRAVDVSDAKHDLYNYLTVSTQGKELAQKLCLYMEHKDDTGTWCHIQIRPPKSGSRVFRK